MKLLISFLLAIITFQYSQAEVVYVKDVLHITVRTGPSSDYRILEAIPSGTKLTILEVTKDKKWSKVRTDSDLVGWVLSRFTMSTLPASVELEIKKRELQLAKKELANLKRELARQQH